MKFLIVVAALVAVAAAQYDFGAVVQGPKTILAGPSGTIHADTGSIVKDPRTVIAAPAIVAPRLIDTHFISSRFLGAPLIDTIGWGGRSLTIPGHTRLFL